MIREAKHDVLAFRVFLRAHWQDLVEQSERLNKEIKRRVDVAEIPESCGVPAVGDGGGDRGAQRMAGHPPLRLRCQYGRTAGSHRS
jgi:hypothetical protein